MFPKLRETPDSAIRPAAMHEFEQEPRTGERLVKFAGDSVCFKLRLGSGKPWPDGWRAFLRTNLGRADALREEILSEVEHGRPPIAKSWHDIPMHCVGNVWEVELPLVEVGYFRAKAYAVDTRGWQHWPAGSDVGINVQPNACRTWNTLYCAFPRMFGPTKRASATTDEALEHRLRELDARGYTVIPPSGKLRDLVRELPHIFDTLGCRILHLLPVNPVPTTYARFGRFGSPYAAGDLLAIDPALIEFDRKTTGVDQFRELTRAVHARGGWVFLDMAINHTGWESTLQWRHPEWFMRKHDGTFVSPGAWGVIWDDLVELEHANPELRRHLADVFVEWCRRGVDGFRCDAGYFVPRDVWRYIIAKVRMEFPDAVFFLEGLGGAWEITEDLLTEGGFQWAYSELFQNYDGLQVSGYLDHAIRQSRSVGVLVHYSETHDNPRLAARGREWSLLRNRLCGLTSVSGCFGFTCGVEWLAKEKVDVHGSSGLAWGNTDNIVPELARLNRLLAEHPCFFDGAHLERLSPTGWPVYALKRTSREGLDSVLVLVNTDISARQKIELTRDQIAPAGFEVDLLNQSPPNTFIEANKVVFDLPPASAYCLAGTMSPRGLSGEAYRRRCAARAMALSVLKNHVPPEHINPAEIDAFADRVERELAGFLSAATYLEEKFDTGNHVRNSCSAESADKGRSPVLAEKLDAARGLFPRVVYWTVSDSRRVTLVPSDHWLLIEHSSPFHVNIETQGATVHWQARSERIGNRHVACYPPRRSAGMAVMHLECYADKPAEVTAGIEFLDTATKAGPIKVRYPEDRTVLLTNGRGAMARLCLDLGAVRSKYDCLLGANLSAEHPVDRHVFAKRARVWASADGFLSPLDARHLVDFDPGPPASWMFHVPAGDGRLVGILVEACMLEGRNTTVLKFSRLASGNMRHQTKHANQRVAGREARVHDVRLTVRVDIEDRNFHQETFRNPGAEHHFASHCRPIESKHAANWEGPCAYIGFEFSPAADRQLRVWAMRNNSPEDRPRNCPPGPGQSTLIAYHPEPEWCEHIQHPVEATRGLTAEGAAYSPGWFELSLGEDESVHVVACADATEPTAEEIRRGFGADGGEPQKHLRVATLDLRTTLTTAARNFLARRGSAWSVIAGYPWFLEWGRDSLIAARGLISLGWLKEAESLLTLFGRFEKDGTLPNMLIGEHGGNRDSSDAPLWYGLACDEYALVLAAAGGSPATTRRSSAESFYSKKVDSTGRSIVDVLRSIAGSYLRGTPNGIRVDPASALVSSPSHFTWMDTNFPPCTPRQGYPIEIQALWIRLLRQLEDLNVPPVAERWGILADRALESMDRLFWLEKKGWFADVLLAVPGQPAVEARPDDALRSNCLIPIALGLLTGAKARMCVAAAQRHLLVPGALRSLAPLPVNPPLPIYGPGGKLLNDPVNPYFGRYEGDEDTRRKPAYHNGTAWVWMLPVFCEALARAWDFQPAAVSAAMAYLCSAKRLLLEGCVGQLPEIMDGDAPHTLRGCDAQAWSVTETLRVLKILEVDKQPDAV